MHAGVSFRTPIDLDFSADGTYVTATRWIEREPLASDPTQVQFVQYPLPGYAVVNVRVAYRLAEDRVTLGLVGTHLGPAHAEHPFGNLIERRVLATLTVVP